MPAARPSTTYEQMFRLVPHVVEDPIPHEGYDQVTGDHPALGVLGGDRPVVIPGKRSVSQGCRHEVLFGGTDAWAPKPTYPQKKLVSPLILATLF